MSAGGSEDPNVQGLIRVAGMAADLWALDSYSKPMTAAERTRGIVETAVMHLIEQGLIALPDDLEQRLREPIDAARSVRPGA